MGSGNLFFSEHLPEILLEESWHVVQFAPYAAGKEATDAWAENRQRWESEAKKYARANLVP
jgi:hypothetical protein